MGYDILNILFGARDDPASGAFWMPYQPIENYGVIGDLRTAALIGKDASLDWLCWPHFDSPSVFGAILDDSKGGVFRLRRPVAT